MYIVSDPKQYDPISQSLYSWLNHTMRTGSPVDGNRKIDEAAAGGRKTGYKFGVSMVIANMLTDLRISRLPKWEKVEMVESHLVERILQKAADEWDATKLMNSGLKASERENWTEPFMVEYRGQLEDLIVPANLAKAEQERHRQAVLSREEESTEADREWLTEMRERQQKELDEIAELLKPAGN